MFQKCACDIACNIEPGYFKSLTHSGECHYIKLYTAFMTTAQCWKFGYKISN